MRKYLQGLDNTSSGAKFARERLLKDADPGTTIIIGSDREGRFLDILGPLPQSHSTRPHLRLVS